MPCSVGQEAPLTWNRVTRIIVMAICLAMTSGCDALKNEVNKAWPPMDLRTATEEASVRAMNGLTKMPRADLYVGISNADIRAHAPQAIMNADSRIKSIELDLDQQALIFDIHFDGMFVEKKFEAAGEIKVAAVPSVDGLTLRVQPIARYAHLDRLKLDKDSTLNSIGQKAAAEAINFLLNTFIDNINGQLSAYETNLSFASSAVLRPEQVLSGLPEAHNFTGKPYMVASEMETGSVLIDQQGLHALVQSKTTRQEVDPSDVRADVAIRQMGSSYDNFAGAFREFGRKHVGENLDQKWDKTTAAASDKFVAAIFNTGLQPINFGADFTIAPQNGSFNELLEIHTTWDFDCSSGINCSFNDHCEDGRDCNPGWNCPSCQWYQADCHVRRVGCEADKVRFRLQCNIENAARTALCKANEAAKTVACEVVKAAKRVGCELNKAWLQLVNGLDIGRFSGDYSLKETTGTALLNGAIITEGIQDITLDATLTAQSKISLSSKFEPYGSGHIFCVAPTNLNLETALGIKAQQLSLSAHREGTEVINDELSIRYRTERQKLTISTEEMPMLRLTLLNPDFLVKCTPLAELVTVGTIFKSFREDLLRSDYEIDVAPFEFQLRIPGFNVPVFDGKIAFHPLQSKGALWFEGKSAPTLHNKQVRTEAIR